MRRLIALVSLVAAGLALASPVWAGGSWLQSVEDVYDPGEEVTLVGYVGATVTDEPIMASLNLVPFSPTTERAQPRWQELGPVNMEPTGLGGYLATRVSIDFTLPFDLDPGVYEIRVMDLSGGFFGDLIGAMLNIGVKPGESRWIEWPLDEPLIAQLPDYAMIAGPGFAVEVRDLRAGHYPAGAEEFMLHPERLDPEKPDTSVGASALTPPHPGFPIEDVIAQTAEPSERDDHTPTTDANGWQVDEPLAGSGPNQIASQVDAPVGIVEHTRGTSWLRILGILGGLTLVALVALRAASGAKAIDDHGNIETREDEMSGAR